MTLPYSDYSDERHVASVMEIHADGSRTPFPDAEWNRRFDTLPPGADPAVHFVNVQSETLDAEDHLWIVDHGSPRGKGVIPGGAKLVEIDLAANKTILTVVIDPALAPEKSFVNDARIDIKRGYAYITETGVGGVLVIDLATGEQRRALTAGEWIDVAPEGPTVEGITVPQSARAKVPRTPDGIALSDDGDWLYLQAHPWLSRTTYRIRTAVLCDASIRPDDAAQHIERVASTVFADGIQLDKEGNLYLTDVERNGIARLRPGASEVELIAADRSLSWPDSIGLAPNGALYVPVAQFHRRAAVAGSDRSQPPYAVFRIDLERHKTP
ncbi:MAG: hypothetical protein K2X57_22970 [Xanthobacteraceae bacterium]|nr:hypothetical protein [Xanthobacteraceae bacterium]